MDKKFSVIIPCYNAEGFVDRAIGSVIRQSLDMSSFEVIAVNDASNDGTLAKLTEWSKRYPDTVRIITYDTNLRQGGARNRALKIAEGEYICFLDADDWMEEDALESFAAVIDAGGYDIVTAKHTEDNVYPSDKDIAAQQAGRDITVERIFDSGDTKEYILSDLGFVWESVYRKSMVCGNEVWFPEHLAYEDIYWQRLIRFYSKKACIIDRITHHYFYHTASTMNKRNAPHHVDRLTCYEMLLDSYEKRGLLKKYYPVIMKDAIETYVFNSYFMFFTVMDDIPDVYERIRSVIYKYFPDWESEYDDSDIPVVFQYMLKLLKRVKTASPADLQPFKDTVEGMLNGL